MSRLEEELRAAIEASGESRYSISQRSGVSEAQLSKFYASGKSLTPDTLERIAAALGFAITLKKQRRTRTTSEE